MARSRSSQNNRTPILTGSAVRLVTFTGVGMVVVDARGVIKGLKGAMVFLRHEMLMGLLSALLHTSVDASSLNSFVGSIVGHQRFPFQHQWDYSVIQAVTLLVPNLAAKRNPVLPIGK